jgi:hypothetical protein
VTGYDTKGKGETVVSTGEEQNSMEHSDAFSALNTLHRLAKEKVGIKDPKYERKILASVVRDTPRRPESSRNESR